MEGRGSLVTDRLEASMGTSCILRNMMALHLERERNSNAVSVDKTAVNNGITKPPLCTMSRFLSVCLRAYLPVGEEPLYVSSILGLNKGSGSRSLSTRLNSTRLNYL
jgi:hypothetical protein